MYEILYFLLLIGLNILIDYLYSENMLFPVLFMLIEIIYGFSIITQSEIYILGLIIFVICYNGLLLYDRREYHV